MFHLSSLRVEDIEALLLKVAKCVSQGQVIKFLPTDSVAEEYWHQKNLIANLVFRYELSWQEKLCRLVNGMHDTQKRTGRQIRYLGAFSNPPGHIEETTLYREGFEVQSVHQFPIYIFQISFPDYPAMDYVDMKYASAFIPHKRMSKIRT